MDIRDLLLGFVGLDLLMAGPFMLVARRQFEARGRWSAPVALWSGVVMHGLLFAAVGLAITDAGSWFTPGWAGWTAGAIAIGFGVGVLIAGRRAYGSQRRVYGLLEDELVVRGIYRRSRNPQYLGYGAIFLGAGLASGSGLGFAVAAVFGSIVHLFITRVEEPHLARAFGAPYLDYRARTKRYWGRCETR